MKARPADTDHPALNERATGLVGRNLTLMEAIHNGQGRAKLGDSVWLVEGPDMPTGSMVVVTEVNGAILTVRDGAE
jgi:inner membrane protein